MVNLKAKWVYIRLKRGYMEILKLRKLKNIKYPKFQKIKKKNNCLDLVDYLHFFNFLNINKIYNWYLIVKNIIDCINRAKFKQIYWFFICASNFHTFTSVKTKICIKIKNKHFFIILKKYLEKNVKLILNIIRKIF